MGEGSGVCIFIPTIPALVLSTGVVGGSVGSPFVGRLLNNLFFLVFLFVLFIGAGREFV